MCCVCVCVYGSCGVVVVRWVGGEIYMPNPPPSLEINSGPWGMGESEMRI